MNEYTSILIRFLHLVWHNGYVFFTRVRSFPPAILCLLVFYLCFDINNPPINAMQGYMSIMPWLFFIMVWFGYLFLSSFNTVGEHILILKINSHFLYSLSKIIFLLGLLMIISLVGCLYPVFINLICVLGGSVYLANGIHLIDFFCAFILCNIIGALGVSLAFFFQPNPFKIRNEFTLSLLIIFALLAITKTQIFSFQPPIYYLLFIFTPMVEILRLFYNQNVFTVDSMLLSAIYGGIYFLITIVSGYFLYQKRVYGPFMPEVKKRET